MKPERVLLVYPQFPNSYWGMQYALPLFRKKAMHPPLSLATVAAICPQEWEFRLIDMNVEEGLNDNDLRWADIVFVGGMVIQAGSMKEVLLRARAMGKKTVVGGPYATGNPELLADVADHQVLDEGEITIPRFLKDLESGQAKPLYRSEQKPDVTTSPVPRFDLLKLDRYNAMNIQFSRGCPFNCEFCDIISLYGRVPRTKTVEQTLAEFEALYKLNYRGPVFLVDDNFIGNKKAVKALLQELVPWMKTRNYPFALATEATVNLADDPPLLEMMANAGFKRVFLGIETPSLDSLKETQKYQNTRKDMVSSVHTITEHGIEVLAGFIVGFDNDQPDIFDRQIQFIQQAEIPWAMVGTLTAMPTTQLWTRLQNEGRILSLPRGDQFGRPNFVTKMDTDLLYNGYLRILKTIYSPESYYDRVFNLLARQDRKAPKELPDSPLPPIKRFILALIAVVNLGIKAPYRWTWWRFMARIVRNHPRGFMPALINSLMGHHFIRYTAEIVEREGHSAPPPSQPSVMSAAKA